MSQIKSTDQGKSIEPSVTTELFLVRHGTPKLTNAMLGVTDSPLSAYGWQQLESSTGKLKNISSVISSPLARCEEFARHYAEQQQCQLILNDQLREYNFGAWDGVSYRQLQQNFPQDFGKFLQNPFQFPPPNGEHLSEFNQRVTQAIEQLAIHHRDQNLVIFTHAGVIRTLVAWCVGMDYKQGQQFQRFAVNYASITHISIYHGDELYPQLKYLNLPGTQE